MKENRFSNQVVLFMVNGKTVEAKQYTYESVKALFDVVHCLGQVVYKTNCRTSEKTKYHEAIEQKFQLVQA